MGGFRRRNSEMVLHALPTTYVFVTFVKMGNTMKATTLPEEIGFCLKDCVTSSTVCLENQFLRIYERTK